MIEKIEKYTAMVWADREMDLLRKHRCLCVNCSVWKDDDGTKCEMASSLYDICKTNNLALMVTRCPNFKERTKW